MSRQHFYFAFLTVFFSFIAASTAFATPVEISDITDSIHESTSSLPYFMAALAYLSGVLLAVLGIIKTLEHVTNPSQTPIRVPVIRFAIGGALFALPIILEAAYNTISGGGTTVALGPFAVADSLSLAFGTNTVAENGFNTMLADMIASTERIPDLVSAVAYLLGILMIISALFKIRDHVDDPNRSSLKDAVIRLLIAGGLIGLPVVFEAMYVTMAGSGLGLNATIVNFFGNGGLGFYASSVDGGLVSCGTVHTGTPSTIGDVICLAMENATVFPALLAGISYVLGLILGVWALIKIRDHVTNPAQTSLWEGVSRLIAGGAFFAMPVIAFAISSSLTPSAIHSAATINTGFQETLGCGPGNSLDMAMVCFMQNIIGPSHVVLNFFCFVAGLIFIMVGTSRIIKSAQDGPKGPGGLGTVSTFVVGGILISATTILSAISESLFDTSQTATTASLTYTSGMTTAETDAAYNVVSAVLKFMIIIGMISFVRGIFIMRDVAEGNQQASTMAGMTHIIGGALAVNLGPLLNAVQTTLGITAFGVTFS
ncbi:MAG: hypothetical protein ACRBDL_06510 [Alphaproteobacteria bacterium]